MMKEQTRLELNISSLIWENWTNRGTGSSAVSVTSDQLHNTATQSLTHLFFDVAVLEDEGEGGDVLPVHAIAAAHLNCVFDALVNLLGGGLPNVSQRAVCKGGQDLNFLGEKQNKNAAQFKRFSTDTFLSTLLGFVFAHFSSYAVHVDGAAKGNLRAPGAVGFLDFGRQQQVGLLSVLLRAYEESIDVVFMQELVPVATVAGLCLVGALQAVQCGPRDVNAP